MRRSHQFVGAIIACAALILTIYHTITPRDRIVRGHHSSLSMNNYDNNDPTIVIPSSHIQLRRVLTNNDHHLVDHIWQRDAISTWNTTTFEQQRHALSRSSMKCDQRQWGRHLITRCHLHHVILDRGEFVVAEDHSSHPVLSSRDDTYTRTIVNRSIDYSAPKHHHNSSRVLRMSFMPSYDMGSWHARHPTIIEQSSTRWLSLQPLCHHIIMPPFIVFHILEFGQHWHTIADSFMGVWTHMRERDQLRVRPGHRRDHVILAPTNRGHTRDNDGVGTDDDDGIHSNLGVYHPLYSTLTSHPILSWQNMWLRASYDAPICFDSMMAGINVDTNPYVSHGRRRGGHVAYRTQLWMQWVFRHLHVPISLPSLSRMITIRSEQPLPLPIQSLPWPPSLAALNDDILIDDEINDDDILHDDIIDDTTIPSTSDTRINGDNGDVPLLSVNSTVRARVPTLLLVVRTSKRILLNADDMAQMARSLGLRVIVIDWSHNSEYVPDRSLRSQLSLARSIDIYAGLTGTGLFNSFFMRPGSVMIQLLPFGARRGKVGGNFRNLAMEGPGQYIGYESSCNHTIKCHSARLRGVDDHDRLLPSAAKSAAQQRAEQLAALNNTHLMHIHNSLWDGIGCYRPNVNESLDAQDQLALTIALDDWHALLLQAILMLPPSVYGIYQSQWFHNPYDTDHPLLNTASWSHASTPDVAWAETHTSIDVRTPAHRPPDDYSNGSMTYDAADDYDRRRRKRERQQRRQAERELRAAEAERARDARNAHRGDDQLLEQYLRDFDKQFKEKDRSKEKKNDRDKERAPKKKTTKKRRSRSND